MARGNANGKRKDKQVYIPKPKNPKPSAKEHPTKDNTCHHCKEVGHWKRNCSVYLAELLKKKKQVGSASSSDDELFDQCVSYLSGKMTRKPFPHRPERATDLLEIIHTDVSGPLRHVSRHGASYFITFTDDYSRYGYVYLLKHKVELTPPYTPQHNRDYALESATHILNMVLTKKVDKTPYELWYGKVHNLSYLKIPKGNDSGRAMGLEEIQDEDTSPSEITSEIPMEDEGFEPPQEEVIPVCRSEKTHRAPDHLCLNVEAGEHSIWDLNEPTSYKAAMLDSESNKWIDAMNT
ncbi:transcription initiation factor IIB-2 [Tanacetum coccineum]